MTTIGSMKSDHSKRREPEVDASAQQTKISTKCGECQQVKCLCAQRLLTAIELGVPLPTALQGLSVKETAEATARTNASLSTTGVDHVAKQMTETQMVPTTTMAQLKPGDRPDRALIKA